MGRNKMGDAAKQAMLRIRVTEAEQKEITAAAEHAGVSLSEWMRELALLKAREVPIKKPEESHDNASAVVDQVPTVKAAKKRKGTA